MQGDFLFTDFFAGDFQPASAHLCDVDQFMRQRFDCITQPASQAHHSVEFFRRFIAEARSTHQLVTTNGLTIRLASQFDCKLEFFVGFFGK